VCAPGERLCARAPGLGRPRAGPPGRAARRLGKRAAPVRRARLGQGAAAVRPAQAPVTTHTLLRRVPNHACTHLLPNEVTNRACEILQSSARMARSNTAQRTALVRDCRTASAGRVWGVQAPDSRVPYLADAARAALFRALERSATLALALCHAHAIALKDLQVRTPACLRSDRQVASAHSRRVATSSQRAWSEQKSCGVSWAQRGTNARSVPLAHRDLQARPHGCWHGSASTSCMRMASPCERTS